MFPRQRANGSVGARSFNRSCRQVEGLTDVTALTDDSNADWWLALLSLLQRIALS
jgi:hypothetical protein